MPYNVQSGFLDSYINKAVIDKIIFFYHIAPISHTNKIVLLE